VIITSNNKAVAITKSDSTDMVDFQQNNRLTNAIYVGGGGDVVVVFQDGTTQTFAGAVAGSVLPVAARRVNSTSTTATQMLALYQI